ncbi:hypothetical protein LINGRAPRIM_LOCUS2382, partial [Linum grandiflorum]
MSNCCFYTSHSGISFSICSVYPKLHICIYIYQVKPSHVAFLPPTKNCVYLTSRVTEYQKERKELCRTATGTQTRLSATR